MIAGFAALTSGFGIGAALFGSLGLAAVLIWPRLQSYQGAVAVQCGGAVAFAAYFALGGASTASASCILGLVQLVTASLVRDRRFVIGVYAGTLLCAGLIAAWTWNGIPTVLASIGCMVSTLARMQSSTYRIDVLP
jgi:hypothetical protein